MNPDAPMTPREELEMRLTALLMGELAPEEAAVLEKKMAADLDLQDLHARLRQAMELLREASALPEQPAPVQLSTERRERLFAHFKMPTPPPAPITELPRRDWSWVVPLGLAASLIALLGGTLFINGFVQSKASRLTGNEQDGGALDFSAAESALEAPAARTNQLSMQPKNLRGWREAGVRQQGDDVSLGREAAVREKSDRSALTIPLPADPAEAAQTATSAGTISANSAFKLYSTSEMTRGTDAPTAAADSRGSARLPTLVTAGKTQVSAEPASKKSARAAEQPVALGLALLAENESRLAGDKSAPAPAAPPAGPATAHEYFFDFDDDGATKVATEKLGLGDLSTNGALFGTQTAPAAPMEADAFGRKETEIIGRFGGVRGGAGTSNSTAVDALVLNRTNSDLGATALSAGVVRLGEMERADGLSDRGEVLAKNAPEAMDKLLDSLEVTKSLKDRVNVRAEDQVGLVASDSDFAVETKTKSIPPDVRIDYGLSIQAPRAEEVRRSLGVSEVELGGAVRKDAEQGKDKKGQNPIIGRASFWSDDETVKPNPDMAAEGWMTLSPDAQHNLYSRKTEPVGKPAAAARETALPSKPADGVQAEDLDALTVLPQVVEFNYNRAIKTPADGEAKQKPAPGGKPAQTAKLEKPKLQGVVQQEMKKVEEAEVEVASQPKPAAAVPQPEMATSANAFSTFSLNVSDVAFKLAGASLEQGKMPELATVRSEEFINAFDYRDPEPAAGAPLAFASELARYPFAQNRDLLRLSVKTAAAGRQPGRALNLVLLLDNSGSMERADRVGILREALRVLSSQLQPQDKLSVVTFARTPRLWADGVAGDQAGEVTARVGEITPQGGTNLAAALDLGYATALRHYQPGSINRVVMLTDGAANLGDVNPDALRKKVEAHRQQGVALDCFGIGWEGLDDTLLEALARNGDGRYGFINTPEEAATNFAAQLAGALRVAAADVKVQVEWNPRRVTAYRQIGYAKHQLKKEQFRDNTVDAAEIGAAESGNALYVVEVNPRGTGDLATVRVRFKVPGTSDYKEHEWTVPFTANVPPLEQASPALRLAGTASAFSEWLAAGPYATEVTPERLLGLLNGVPAIYGADPRPQKLEWMIRTAKSVSGK